LAGPVKVQGVVLRSLRYGEADRILHVYTPQRGKLGAIAKGVRRARSRFGGRLEPFFRLNLVLHEGRGDLLTVTAAETVAGHPRLREDAVALDTAARACDAVGRLFDTSEPHPGVYNLLCNELALLDARAGADGFSGHANQLAFRLKLLLAAGLAPQLAACASCGAGSFALGQEAHSFLVDAIGRPLADTPPADARTLRQAERAIDDTLEHHAGIRWRHAAAR
jgi:DNA repair protein RecO (recombination protein O)